MEIPYCIILNHQKYILTLFARKMIDLVSKTVGFEADTKQLYEESFFPNLTIYKIFLLFSVHFMAIKNKIK